jgi:Plasmid pRiA4b ORF-3-like protein
VAVARTWLQIKVELLGGLDIECDPPPGRVFAVSPSTTFERLAGAINAAFGRWDFSHLHFFELADGRQIGFPDDEDSGVGLGWLDHGAVKLGTALKPGDEFSFVFDMGDDWRHRCRVLADKLDAREAFREVPREPVILWGWGWLPDQYGREVEDDAGAY